MKSARYSENSELSSLRQSQEATRFWRLACVVGVACGLLACSREAAPPVAHEARPQSAVAATPAAPVHRGAAGADHGSWATAGDSVPEALREPCAKVSSLVRSVVGAAPPSTKITEFITAKAFDKARQKAIADLNIP